MKKKIELFSKLRREVKVDNASLWRRILTLLIVSLVVTLIVEGFNQRGFIQLARYIVARPQSIIMNLMIVLTSMSISELVRRRKAMISVISVIWLILGFANYMVCRNRTLPLIGGDLAITYAVASLITVYFSGFEILLMFIGSVAIILGIVWMFIYTSRREKMNYAFSLGCVALMLLATFFMNMLFVKGGLLPDNFKDRVNSYRDYGFTTCFTMTFMQSGMDEPKEYSADKIEEIIEEIDEPAASGTSAPRFGSEETQKPNIVLVQLESFFDPLTMRDAILTRDPIPYTRELSASLPNASLHVPAVGGLTANVEFEVLTGFNIDFLGAGVIPYSNVLLDTTCESLAHVLGRHGYYSTALHNNTGVFFTRNEVYANLGFDCFDPLETMPSPKYNEVGWAKDEVLTSEIMRAMSASDERDFVFAVTVASHGKYSDTYEPKQGDIGVLKAPEEIFLGAFQNYVNIIPEVDSFVKGLIEELNAFDEPVVAVFYGDHLPGIGLKEDMLVNGDLYASHYFIWNNFGETFDAPSMQAYRMGAELMRQIGITDGVMNKFHQSYEINVEDEDYLNKLEALQYDMLYGEQNAYMDAGVPEKTQISIGITPVVVKSASVEYGRLLIKGEGFTEYSRVIAGEEVLPAVFVDDTQIVVALDEDMYNSLPDKICVAQYTKKEGVELCRSEEIAVTRSLTHY